LRRQTTETLKAADDQPIRNLVDATTDAWVPLGSLLLRVGAIDPEQLEIALTEKERSPRRLGEILVEWGWVPSVAIARALAEQYGIPFLDLSETEVDEGVARLLPEDTARRLQALLIRRLPDHLLLVGLADPTDVLAAEELRSTLGTGICLNIVDIEALEAAHSRVYGSRVAAD
jgi:type IV pilus assembly protein PilB